MPIPTNIMELVATTILQRKHMGYFPDQNGNPQPATVRQFSAGIMARFGFSITDWTPTGPPVTAFVHYGRWLAVCECGGAEYLNEAEPIFVCCSVGCFNRRNGFRPRPVIWPANWRQIEAVLLKREGPQAPGGFSPRTWTTETIAELQAENLARGDEV